MRSFTPLIWAVPVVLLLLALAPLPYGYYTLLRIVVCAAAAFLAFKQFQENQRVSGWMVTLLAIAMLFNPLIPVHLNREIWTFIDLVVAAIFVAHFVIIRRKEEK